MNTQRAGWVSVLGAHSASFSSQKKKRRDFVFCVYLRLFRTTAAATNATMTIAAAMAMYVVVMSVPAGGGACVGDGDTGAEVGACVGVGMTTGVGVGTGGAVIVGVVVTCGAAFSPTVRYVVS
jgi:hypothetical protein